jgi:hypothetical protein
VFLAYVERRPQRLHEDLRDLAIEAFMRHGHAREGANEFQETEVRTVSSSRLPTLMGVVDLWLPGNLWHRQIGDKEQVLEHKEQLLERRIAWLEREMVQSLSLQIILVSLLVGGLAYWLTVDTVGVLGAIGFAIVVCLVSGWYSHRHAFRGASAEVKLRALGRY